MSRMNSSVNRFGDSLVQRNTASPVGRFGDVSVSSQERKKPEPTILWGDQQVPVREILRVADDNNVNPETIARLGTWQGRLESQLGRTFVGQGLNRAAQGTGQLASAGLSLGSRAAETIAGVIGAEDTAKNIAQFRSNIHRNQELRSEFLNFIEKGGDTEGLLGERGSRIYNGISNTLGNIGVAGKVVKGSQAAILAITGGEALDSGIEDGRKAGLEGLELASFAANRATVETGLTYMFGRVGERLGVSSFEEALSPGMRAAVVRTMTDGKLTKALFSAAKSSKGNAKFMSAIEPLKMKGAFSPAMGAIGGAGMEFLEEGTIAAIQQAMDVDAGVRKSFNIGEVLEAGMTGAASRAALSANSTINRVLNKDKKAIGEIVKGVRAAEEAIEAAGGPSVESLTPEPQGAETGKGTQPGKDAAPIPAPPDTGPTQQGDRLSKKFFQTATPEMLQEIRGGLNRKEFERVTGLKNTTEQFRKTFKETLEVYANSDPDSVRRTAHSGDLPQTGEKGVNSDPTAAAPPTDDATVPPATPDSEQVEGEDDLTGVQKDLIARNREMLDLMEIPRQAGDQLSFSEALDDAREKGVPGRARDIAQNVLDNPRSMSPIESAGLTLRLRDLNTDFQDVIGQIVNTNDPNELKILDAQSSRIQEEADLLLRAANLSGSERGRALVFQKLALNKNMDVLSVVARARAAKGGELTDREMTVLTADAQAVENADNSLTITKKDRDAKQKQIRRINQTLTDPKVRRLNKLEKDIKNWEDLVNGDTDYINRQQNVVTPLSAADTTRLELAQKRVAGVRQKIADAGPEVLELKEAISKDPKLIPDPEGKEIGKLEAEVMRLREEVESLDTILRDKSLAAYKARVQLADTQRQLRPMTLMEKVRTPIDLFRSIVSSPDFPFGRQGLLALMANPSLIPSTVARSVNSFLSKEESLRQDWQAENHPNRAIHEAAGLGLVYPGDELFKRESEFRSTLADKIPIVGASARAYRTFLNDLRIQMFENLANTLPKDGAPTPQELQALGFFVNVATGRGGLGNFEKAADNLSTVFFSPRYTVSRFQWLTGAPLFYSAKVGSPNTTRAIANQYARTGAAYVTLAGMVPALAYALGYDEDEVGFSLDPRSSDYMKLKIGNKRIDLGGGISQTGRIISTIVTGQRVNAAGDVEKNRPDQQLDSIVRYVRSKLAPVVGGGVDLATGKTVDYKDATLARTVVRQVVPIMFQHGVDSMMQEGYDRIVAQDAMSLAMFGQLFTAPFRDEEGKLTTEPLSDALISMLGVGVQNYNEPQSKPRRKFGYSGR